MASLNEIARSSSPMLTTNRSGFPAYRMEAIPKLVSMALTTMLHEPKYYGDTSDTLLVLAQRLCEHGEGEFVARLAVWTRTEGHLRSVSHALAAVVAHACPGQDFVRPAIRRIASMRGDDGTEIVASYLALYGKPIPNALRRGVADALGTMSAYSIAKYQSGSREVKLRDVLRICHPTPRDEEAAAAMRACIDGTLRFPKSWETELSARGNTAEVWNELISEGRVGYMAMLRNLCNMVKAGADMRPVIRTLTDPEAVHKSRQLPFRFYSAWRELRALSVFDPDMPFRARRAVAKLEVALSKAMTIACDNADRLEGRTAVFIDTSGSMQATLSRNSKVTCRDVAAVMGAMVTRISEDAWTCTFDIIARPLQFAGYDILKDAASVTSEGGCTNMGSAFDLLSESGFDADRIILLSDNEVNVFRYLPKSGRKDFFHREVIQSCLDSYREKVGHDVWCHAIDLQGYGTQQFTGPKVNIIAGWSEAVLRFIALAEKDTGSLIEEISAIEL